jgi:uncharacterized protein
LKDDLRIPLERIPDEGFDLNIEIKPEMLNVEDVECPPMSGVKLIGRLERLGDQGAVFRGRSIGELTVECSLGLALFQLQVDEPMVAYFQTPPSGEEAPGGEVECEEKDLEVYYLRDTDTVDLTSPLRDQLLLAIPIQPICPGKCLGEELDICRRLQEGEGVEDADPRWVSLKEWGEAKS